MNKTTKDDRKIIIEIQKRPNDSRQYRYYYKVFYSDDERRGEGGFSRYLWLAKAYARGDRAKLLNKDYLVFREEVSINDYTAREE